MGGALYRIDADDERSRGEIARLSHHTEMDKFFSTVERRAFLMARTALRNQEDALDVVQDAMMMLVKNYRHKPADEWRLLFFRILNNRIKDTIRRRMVRSKFGGWLPLSGQENEEAGDPFQQVADSAANNPAEDLARRQSMEALASAVANLPTRQREAFMLRCWEGLSTIETAAVMKCSEGSVKTHYSRALYFLQEQLKEYRDD